MSNRIYLAAAIGCLSLQAAMPAAADDSKCCLRLTPYYWAVGIDGSIEDNRGSTTDQVDFNNDIGDITDNLEFNGSLMLEHNAGHWVNFAALDYMKVDNNDTGLVTMTGNRVKMETDTTLLTAATGYRFGTGEGSHVDLMVGVRYAKLDAEASANGFSINGDSDLTDGIVMLRPRLALGKNWAFSPTLSVGGGDSDLVWEMAPEFVYTNNCCNLEFRFGYRSVNYEYEENSVKLDFSFAGPMAGVGFAF
ncbi:MAG: hypothetical protein IPJ33_14835 [Gammaproteobacteria bacterium]|jgi:hypothetical protein|nr:hypothetical protein [Gammaproteobacteria bacterium]MBP6053528.1 hypothetical protein [Pseudomonadales bacterium]MBK6584960.1 hypothetical protein [Gammaproteobacteria bacterium]MBK7170784.1 hypothetical protein [Gammaproteobacteria bacterium]MBK7729717.1 hypothetical protein [Gammaproteobacteria bacterium]